MTHFRTVSTPILPDGVRVVREEPTAGSVPLLRNPAWCSGHPWLFQGVTSAAGDFDLRLFGAEPGEAARARWETLRLESGFSTVVHSRQVHGAVVRVHRAGGGGLLLAEPGDSHCTREADCLLAVSVADCVPVSLVDPDLGAVALVHAGWRGTAAGVLESTLEVLRDHLGVSTGRLVMHLGPAISGERYEVGPEVFEALALPRPRGPALLDLRACLAQRARAAGIIPDRITVSAWCTMDHASPFYSHRGGDQGRQVALLGIRPGQRQRGQGDNDAR